MIVGMHEAKTQLSRLVKLALEGEEILLASRGEVLVCLTPVAPPLGKRRLGWMKSKGQLTPGWETDEHFSGYQADPLTECVAGF
jgi:antitoxin (DNA-binding transcriptional repressor) of toxin-antitoxin stability system